MSAVSDSDDDLPISELIKKRKAEKAKDEILPIPNKKKVKDEILPTSSKKKVSEESAPAPVKRQSKSSIGHSADYYEETEKGRMVQSLLVRWWYAMQWPTEKDIGVPPAGYETLDGFKGVFISTRTDSLGEILDLRDKSTCPNLINISKFHASKVKQLLITALEKQIDILQQQIKNSRTNADEEEEEESTGVSATLIKDLKDELKSVKKIDANKAETEAKKYTFGKK